MRVKNNTAWSTAQLRAVFARVAAEVRKTEGKLNWPLKVTVNYGRNSSSSNWIGGNAYLRSGTMKITLPHPVKWPMDVRNLAHTFAHELLHCYGVNHAQMTGAQMRMMGNGDEFAYVDGLKVEASASKATPTKQKADVQITRYLRVVSSIERNETKAARLARAYRKLADRRRYYERVLEADGRLAALKAKGR